MRSIQLSSNNDLSSVTQMFLDLEINEFFQACDYISRLPYGRNSDRANYHLVLLEGCGTCSTKHALLAQLAHEQGVPVSLILGIFEMNSQNLPEIHPVLAETSLSSIPEAHCYLRYENKIFDFTKFPSPPFASLCTFERVIMPDQIGEHKESLHKEYLTNWIIEKDITAYSFEQIWQIRENCIRALSGSGNHAT